MPSLKDIRNRINSVKSTQQVTKAMKIVSATKLKKAQGRMIALRPYASKLMEPRHMQQPLRPGADLNIWNDIKDWLTSFEQGNGPQAILERNFVLAGFPEWWRKENWREALDRFRADLMTFEVQFEEMSK